MDNLSAMAVFIEVVQAHSFSAAAARLGLSKSAVSKRISGLEDRLGARLLNRTTRRLSLTEVGAAYFERCGQILAEIEDAEAAVGRLQFEPRGTLRVNAATSFSLLHLARVIPDFLERYPDIRIDLTLNDRLIDVVEEGYDLALRIAQLPDSSLIARKIASTCMVVCGSPDYFRRHGVPRTPAELSAHNCLIYTNVATPDDWRFHGADGPVSVRVSGNYRANNGDMLRAALLAGVGVGMSPTFLVGQDIQAGALQVVLPGLVAKTQSIYAVYPHSRHLSAKVRGFVDFLVERFGAEPYWEAGFPSP